MFNTDEDPFASLRGDPLATRQGSDKQTVNTLPENRHTCQQCGGTGKYLGVRVHQHKDKCFACGGKGYFIKSAAERFKTNQRAKERKQERIAEDVVAFDEENKGLREYLAGAASWSEFAASLHASLLKYGSLTEKQLAAALSMRAKQAAREAEKAVAREAVKAQEVQAQATVAAIETVQPTLARMAEAFLTSAAHLEFPKMHLQTEDGLPVVLSRAGAKSQMAGCINITDGKAFGQNIFYGRITPDGKALYRNAPASVIAMLHAFNENPAAEILVQGRRTGRCCCCGRKLTDPVSIANGIGPVCAENWGF